MPEQPALHIEPRAGVGSHYARKVRNSGRIPAVLYGHGGRPETISLDATEFRRQIKPDHYGAALVRLVHGDADAGTALVKSVQADVLKGGGSILSVDLQRVSAEERVHVTVPIVIHGEPEGLRYGGILEQPLRALNIRCRASEVPDQLEYDVTPLHIGDAVHTSQLALPAGAELLDKTDEVVAVVLSPTVPAMEEPVSIEPNVSGPELTGDKQKVDFPTER